MEQFSINAENFDLELTMTCGQTFCWHRLKGDLYGEGSEKFYTVRSDEPVVVWQEGDTLFAETELSRSEVRKALGLDHKLESVFDEFPEDEIVEKARNEFWGLRVVQDEFLPCLVSYLCSPQMRIPRIKKMHNEIARKYGGTVQKDGKEFLRFPRLGELSDAEEDDLRELGVGYRAEYIVETIKLLEEGFDPGKVRHKEYLEAREEMKSLYGVGDKVADCVLLFSLGFHQASPLDTWAWKSIETHYPELHEEDDYEATSENLLNYFGEKAGYAQEYIFHAARNGVLDV